MPPHECTQEQQLNAKLADISEKLQLVLVQQNEIKNINVMCVRLENWLKDHEHRLQHVEGAQNACKISTVDENVNALRDEIAAVVKEINSVKKAPGQVALGFLKSVALLAVGAGFTLLAKG